MYFLTASHICRSCWRAAWLAPPPSRRLRRWSAARSSSRCFELLWAALGCGACMARLGKQCSHPANSRAGAESCVVGDPHPPAAIPSADGQAAQRLAGADALAHLPLRQGATPRFSIIHHASAPQSTGPRLPVSPQACIITPRRPLLCRRPSALPALLPACRGPAGPLPRQRRLRPAHRALCRRALLGL